MSCRGIMGCGSMFAALESTGMSAVGRSTVPCVDARSAEVAASRCRIVTGYRRPSHRTARRNST
jgi:hypothetical protein